MTADTGPPRLLKAWSRLVASLSADELAATGVWEELNGRYSDEGRTYHTWSHIDHVHQVMEWILTRTVAPRPAIELAVFFHDAVYETAGDARADNEAASAQLARTACSLMDLPDDLSRQVHNLVLVTRNHRARNPEQAVLCDADLAILASDPQTYDIYRRAIRVEYTHVDDETYRVGRAKVLNGFLKRKHIYATSLMRDRGESTARRNIERELNELS